MSSHFAGSGPASSAGAAAQSVVDARRSAGARVSARAAAASSMILDSMRFG